MYDDDDDDDYPLEIVNALTGERYRVWVPSKAESVAPETVPQKPKAPALDHEAIYRQRREQVAGQESTPPQRSRLLQRPVTKPAAKMPDAEEIYRRRREQVESYRNEDPA